MSSLRMVDFPAPFSPTWQQTTADNQGFDLGEAPPTHDTYDADPRVQVSRQVQSGEEPLVP